MEETVHFVSGSFTLEGLLERNASDWGVVITHPHSLYGGDMYNTVVETIAWAYKSKGCTTFRFNFRGVGASQGAFDNGVGEQDDLCAAIEFLKDMGISTLDLAGYSFGVSVNIKAIEKAMVDGQITRMVMVSPPVGLIDLDRVKTIRQLGLVVSGSEDHIAPFHTIEKLIPLWNPNAQLSIIEGADHFYSGYMDQLQSILDDYL